MSDQQEFLISYFSFAVINLIAVLLLRFRLSGEKFSISDILISIFLIFTPGVNIMIGGLGLCFGLIIVIGMLFDTNTMKKKRF